SVLSATFFGALLFVISGLGLIDVLSPDNGGLVGKISGSLEIPFGFTASLVILSALAVASTLIALNSPLKIYRRVKEDVLSASPEPEIKIAASPAEADKAEEAESKPAAVKKQDEGKIVEYKEKDGAIKDAPVRKMKNYVPPPLSLLHSVSEKPTFGDLRANANVIKRTFESFGIPVEMGEINVGPSITRYTLKPAEGVKLSRITALHQDLALALASHPIRIEAPIPGKSLVGIEVPNKSAALVRLGTMLGYPEFKKIGGLGFVLGRDVSGEPIFGDVTKMPHMLIAGSTGSGKSVMIHSLLMSLLYGHSPETMRLILIDPKKVELSIYDGIPHLISPVITEGKKAIGVFRWAINEMERRYELLLSAGSRDIKSYNASKPQEILPWITIVVDELADLMATYGREIEGSIVRLAQMARATGIHLVLSTQRPSVEVITGLIKANITSRIALQVASQIDSRTILDSAGAEKLLGNGDMLFVSSEFSKPKRIQGAFITEEEVKKVIHFIGENNKESGGDEVNFEKTPASGGQDIFNDFSGDDSDELFDEAVATVRDAKKASASLLQRRLKVGYARAARLLDLMEARGIVGPGEGAKPREVFVENAENG
ncbi:MAG: DNA translocase FtsK, partial [Patescibacteria group bacterium]